MNQNMVQPDVMLNGLQKNLRALYLSEKILTRRILQNMTLLYTAVVSMPAV